ncbi:hypothetical protein D3C81_1620270 [compost metagenome]
MQHADGDQVALQHGADLGDDRRHVHAALLQVAAARVEHRLELLDQEGAVAALAQHRGHDAGEGDDPLEVVHVLRVDEDLEGPALLVGRAGVEHHVVDGHVQRVLEQRRLDLVGRADQHLRTLQRLVHLHHGSRRGSFRTGLFLGHVDYLEALDFLSDLDGHRVSPTAQYLP